MKHKSFFPPSGCHGSLRTFTKHQTNKPTPDKKLKLFLCSFSFYKLILNLFLVTPKEKLGLQIWFNADQPLPPGGWAIKPLHS